MSKKLLKTLTKFAISGLLLYLVFTKIEFSQIIDLYKNSNSTYILLAFVLFILSQLVSSYRLNYIFHQNNFKLTQFSNLKLYFVGMFYNFFIPGGVGGDAYKVYLLNKKFDWKLKTLTQSVLIDRLVGLVAIFCILSLMVSYLFFDSSWIIALGAILSIVIFFLSRFALKIIYKKVRSIFLVSFWYSIVIQLLQIGSIYAIIKAFEIQVQEMISYFFIFLTSSVLSVVSFAGFGAREYVFLKSSEFLSTDPSFATSIGLSFNLITAIVSLLGVIFMLMKLDLKTN